MKRAPRMFVLSFAAMLAGCGAFDTGEIWESGRFRIFWIDDPYDVRLGYNIGGGSYSRVVDPCVYAVGENEQFIAVAQATKTVGTTVYVIDKAKYDPDRNPSDAIEGPFSALEYETASASRGFPRTKELFNPGRCRTEV